MDGGTEAVARRARFGEEDVIAGDGVALHPVFEIGPVDVRRVEIEARDSDGDSKSVLPKEAWRTANFDAPHRCIYTRRS